MDSGDVDFNFLKFFFLKVGTSRSFYISQGQGPVQVELNKMRLGQGSQKGPVSWQAKAAPVLHYEGRNWHGSHICILQVLQVRYWISRKGVLPARERVASQAACLPKPQKECRPAEPARHSPQWLLAVRAMKQFSRTLYFSAVDNWEFTLPSYRVNIRSLMAHKRNVIS